MTAVAHVLRDGCGWCRGPIPAGARRDSIYCKVGCRQAAHRFGVGAVARRRTTTPLRLAYADPPYPKLARRYYRHHPDYAGEVDHDALLSRLQEYDGWALSTSAKALPDVLALCVARRLPVRVAAWVRGARPHARSTGPLSAWEPVIYVSGRHVLPTRDLEGDATPGAVEARGPTRRGSTPATRRPAPARHDALVFHSRPRLTDPDRVIGAKPATFAYWLFDLLGALPGDELDDMFPGSRGIERAWSVYVSRGDGDDASSPPAADATA